MGRSEKRPDPRPSYAQELNYTGVYWNKGGKQSPYWQCKLWGKPTLGEGRGELTLGYFRANRADYIKAAKAWDRARIAKAYVLKELIHLLSPEAEKRGYKLNFARQNYQDVIDMLKGVEIPKNTDAVRALVKAVALEKPLPQPGSPATSHEAADSDEEVKLQDLITEKDASDEAEESPLPSVRRAAGQASGRRKRSDTPPEDTPAAKVQKRAPPRTVPTSVAAEVQRAQAAEELRRDLLEAELKIESLAEKCAGLERSNAGLERSNAGLERSNAGLEALVAELKDSKTELKRSKTELKRSNAQQQQQQERLVTHLEQFNAFVLEENEELRRLLSRADNQ